MATSQPKAVTFMNWCLVPLDIDAVITSGKCSPGDQEALRKFKALLQWCIAALPQEVRAKIAAASAAAVAATATEAGGQGPAATATNVAATAAEAAQAGGQGPGPCEQLEAALNSFQSKAEEVSEFASGAAALEQSAPGADIDGIEQQLSEASATDAKVASCSQKIDALIPLVEQLEAGNHSQAGAAWARLDELRDQLGRVRADQQAWRQKLSKELERQNTIADLVKDAGLQTTRLSTYADTLQALLDAPAPVAGSGPDAVREQLDTMRSFLEQPAAVEEWLQSIRDGVAHLGSDELAYAGAGEASAAADALAERLAGVAAAAEARQVRLEEQLGSEEALVATRKDFVAGSSKQDAWLASTSELLKQSAPGADIARIEQQLSEASVTDAKVASCSQKIDGLSPLVEQLEAGNHSQAGADRARLDELRDQLGRVEADQQAWRQKLSKELERQNTIADLVKDAGLQTT
eukprot:g4336.t1